MPKPPAPLPHELDQLDEDLWAVEQHRHQLGVHFRNRMTVVRLREGEQAGRLWIHSPVTIDDKLATSIDALGQVAYLVSPNKAHHLFAAGVKTRYPAAQWWGAPGLANKEGLAIEATLPTGDASLPWMPEIDSVFVPGVPRLNETVFFHAASGSLICSDFVMNIEGDSGVVARFVWRTLGLQWGVRQSRPWRKWFTKDAKAQAVAARKVLAWPISRIVPAHGELVEARAQEQLAAALAWLTQP